MRLPVQLSRIDTDIGDNVVFPGAKVYFTPDVCHPELYEFAYGPMSLSEPCKHSVLGSIDDEQSFRVV